MRVPAGMSVVMKVKEPEKMGSHPVRAQDHQMFRVLALERAHVNVETAKRSMQHIWKPWWSLLKLGMRSNRPGTL